MILRVVRSSIKKKLSEKTKVKKCTTNTEEQEFVLICKQQQQQQQQQQHQRYLLGVDSHLSGVQAASVKRPKY